LKGSFCRGRGRGGKKEKGENYFLLFPHRKKKKEEILFYFLYTRGKEEWGKGGEKV